MKVLGILGTMVWDTIWRAGANAAVEEWGGISYALAGADPACPPDWRIRPLVKVGRDLSENALRFVRRLSAIESLDAFHAFDGLNPRVELTYESNERRCERITGQLPTWSWDELAPGLAGCDALYVNFITGFELDLEVAKRIRGSFDGLIYGDIHSLMLGLGPEGERNPRPLDRYSEWLTCFDFVQMNEAELTTMSHHWGDPWAFAADVVGRSPRSLFVTLGPRGAAYFMMPDALPLAATRPSLIESPQPVRTGKIGSEALAAVDPTGCGDVWGITVFCKLLAGVGLEEAMQTANAAAARCASYYGATGLNSYLKGSVDRA